MAPNSGAATAATTAARICDQSTCVFTSSARLVGSIHRSIPPDLSLESPHRHDGDVLYIIVTPNPAWTAWTGLMSPVRLSAGRHWLSAARCTIPQRPVQPWLRRARSCAGRSRGTTSEGGCTYGCGRWWLVTAAQGGGAQACRGARRAAPGLMVGTAPSMYTLTTRVAARCMSCRAGRDPRQEHHPMAVRLVPSVTGGAARSAGHTEDDAKTSTTDHPSYGVRWNADDQDDQAEADRSGPALQGSPSVVKGTWWIQGAPPRSVRRPQLLAADQKGL